MKKIIGFVAVLVMAIGLVACGASKKPDTEDAHIPGEPDVVGSIKMNQDENLTVVANRDEIEEFIVMCLIRLWMRKKPLQHPSKSPIGTSDTWIFIADASFQGSVSSDFFFNFRAASAIISMVNGIHFLPVTK